MNRKRISLVLAVVGFLVLSSLWWFEPLTRISQAAPAPSSDASFKGKVLHVSTSNMMTAAFLLEKAQVQKIGDRMFLVGTGASDGRMGGWYKGRTVRLQMDHVVSITEFDDLNEARKALETGGGMGALAAYVAPAIVPAEAGEALPVPVRPAAPPPPPSKQ